MLKKRGLSPSPNCPHVPTKIAEETPDETKEPEQDNVPSKRCRNTVKQPCSAHPQAWISVQVVSIYKRLSGRSAANDAEA